MWRNFYYYPNMSLFLKLIFSTVIDDWLVSLSCSSSFSIMRPKYFSFLILLCPLYKPYCYYPIVGWYKYYLISWWSWLIGIAYSGIILVWINWPPAGGKLGEELFDYYFIGYIYMFVGVLLRWSLLFLWRLLLSFLLYSRRARGVRDILDFKILTCFTLTYLPFICWDKFYKLTIFKLNLLNSGFITYDYGICLALVLGSYGVVKVSLTEAIDVFIDDEWLYYYITVCWRPGLC